MMTTLVRHDEGRGTLENVDALPNRGLNTFLRCLATEDIHHPMLSSKLDYLTAPDGPFRRPDRGDCHIGDLKTLGMFADHAANISKISKNKKES